MEKRSSLSFGPVPCRSTMAASLSALPFNSPTGGRRRRDGSRCDAAFSCVLLLRRGARIEPCDSRAEKRQQEPGRSDDILGVRLQDVRRQRGSRFDCQHHGWKNRSQRGVSRFRHRRCDHGQTPGVSSQFRGSCRESRADRLTAVVARNMAQPSSGTPRRDAACNPAMPSDAPTAAARPGCRCGRRGFTLQTRPSQCDRVDATGSTRSSSSRSCERRDCTCRPIP